jgi:tetratricopeptide (TPR) repeat protein
MSGNAERFERAMNQGHNAAWDQTWDQAADFYRQALQEFPENPKALNSLALAMYEMQNFNEALMIYLKASSLTPEDPIPLEKAAELLGKTGQLNSAISAYMKCAELYLKQKDVEKACDLWNKVLFIRSDHLMARSRLALVYERLGRKNEALREYLAIASLFQNAGEIQKAIQAANRALQVEPRSPQAQTVLAMIRAGKMLPKPSRPRQASIPAVSLPQPVQKKNATEELDPISEAQDKALTTLAGLVFEQEEQSDPSSKRGMSDIVRGAFGVLTGQGDQTKILLHISQVVDLQSNKKDRQAIEELERAIELGLDLPAAVYNLGCLQFQDGKYPKAIETLKSIEGNIEYLLPVKLISGKSRYQLKQYREAALDLLEALRYADGQVVEARFASGLSDAYEPILDAQSQQQDPESAIKLCDSILGMLVRADWQKHLAEARHQLPDQDEMFPSPLAEILVTAGSSEIVEALAGVQKLIQSQKLRAAMEEAFHVLSSAPFYLPLHTTIADLLLQQGQINAALEKYATVARSYEVRGEVNRSISLYRKIADLSPMDLRARRNLIDLMLGSGQSNTAIDEYLNLAEMYYNLADLENVRRSIQEAIKIAQEAKVGNPKKFMILAQLADVEMQSLNLRQAQRIYQEMRVLQPDHEPTRLAIVELYLRLGQSNQARNEIADYMNYLVERDKAGEAEAFLDKLEEQYPKEAVLLQQRGELLRRMGRREEAILQFDAAGELYLQKGDKAAAAEVIRSILALNPPNTAQYQQLLAQLRS